MDSKNNSCVTLRVAYLILFKIICAFLLLYILACIITVSCSLIIPLPTPTPIGIRLDSIPTRFQGDWVLHVPPPEAGDLYSEWYARHSDWYKRLVVHIGKSATDCKVLELQKDGELQELETVASVKSIYRGIEIQFQTMTISPMDYFDKEDESQRKAGFSHRSGTPEESYYLGLINLIPYNREK